MAKGISEKENKIRARYGINPVQDELPMSISEDANLDRYYQSLEPQLKSDRLSKLNRLMPGYFSEEETAGGYDEQEEMILDEDGVVRAYVTRKDKSGQLLSKTLTNSIEGVSLTDMGTGGKASGESNPYYEGMQRQKLYKKMMGDLDEEGFLKDDIGKSALQNSWDNSIWSSVDRLTKLIPGLEGGEVGRQLFDKSIEGYQTKEDGIYYNNTKINLPEDIQETFNEWREKKSVYEPDGFLELLGSTALTFAIDAPFFIGAGRGAGMLMKGLAPGLELATSLPGRVTKHITQNMAMMAMTETPRLIEHTVEGGTDAFLEDLKHIGTFSLMAGGFSTVGDYLGMGVSKLLQKPRALQLNEAVQFLRKNPQITQTLAGGFTSGALGYTTGGETTEEKLATALTFAGMHFAAPSAWKSFAKGEQKNIMFEANQVEKFKRAIKAGATIEEASQSARLPEYYERDGEFLYPINKDILATKGEVVRLKEYESDPIKLDKDLAKNYRYITEESSFAKVTLKEALAKGKIKILADGIKEGIPENPYNKEQEKDKYEDYEHGKNLVANQIASTVYAEKLNSIFKKKQLPEDVALNKMIVNFGNNFKMPVSDIKSFVYENLGEYYTEPERLQAYWEGIMPPPLAKDLTKLMEKSAESFVKEVENSGAKAILKHLIPEPGMKLLTAPKEKIPTEPNLQAEANKVKRVMEAEKKVKGTVLPSSGDLFLDFKGTQVPITNIKNGKGEIGNTGVFVDIETAKKTGKVKSKSEEKVKAEKTKAVKTEKPVVAEPTEAELLAEKEFATGKAKEFSITEIEAGRAPTEAQIKLEYDKAIKEYRKQQKPKTEVVNETPKEEMQRGQEEIAGDIAPISPETNTQTQGKEGIQEPIQSIASKPIEPIKSHSEAVAEKKVEQLSKSKKVDESAKALASVIKPGQAILPQIRSKEGQLIPEVTGRIADLESNAREFVTELNKVPGGKKAKAEELVAIALTQHYTASEAATIMAMRGINSDNTKVNKDFVNNTLKKYGIQIKKSGEGVKVSDREIATAGLSNVAKPKASQEKIEEQRLQDEQTSLLKLDAIDKAKKQLRAERFKEGTTEQRKREIDEQVIELNKEQKVWEAKYSEVAKDLFENEQKEIATLKQSPEERIKVEQELKDVFGDKVQVDWDETLPEGRTARTYTDKDGKLHIGFTTLSSEKAPIHEKLHGQMLLAADKITVEQALKEANPEYDGIEGSKSWRDAHEAVVEKAMKGEYDKYGFTEKLRNAWQKLKEFFGAKKMFNSAKFYDDLLNNKIDLKEYGKEETVLYEKGMYLNDRFKKITDYVGELSDFTRKDIGRYIKQITESVYRWSDFKEEISNQAFGNNKEELLNHLDNLIEAKTETYARRYRKLMNGEFTETKAELTAKSKNDIDILNQLKKEVSQLEKKDLTEPLVLYESKGKFTKEELAKAFESDKMATELSELEKWQASKHSSDLIRPFKFTENKLALGIKKIGKIVMNAAMQNKDMANRVKFNPITGDYDLVNPLYHNIYNTAQVGIDKQASEVHRLLKSKEFMNDMKDFLGLGTGKESFTKKYIPYLEGVSNGTRKELIQDVKNNETLEQFVNRVGNELGYTDAEKKVELQYQRTARETQRVRKDGFTKHFKELRTEVGEVLFADMLSRKELEKYFGDKLNYDKPEAEIYKDANRELRLNESLLDEVVKGTANKLYPEYYGFYRNEVRPYSPEYWTISGRKPLNAQGNLATRQEDIVKWDKFNTWAENRKEADRLSAEWTSKGYNLDVKDKIGNLISNQQFDKLTANQLMNLVDAGHVSPNNEIVRALLDAVKSGNYEQHTIKKDYVKGMQHTPQEFEMNTNNLINEAVSASVRKYMLSEMRNKLGSARASLNEFVRSATTTEGQKAKAIFELNEATKLYNQVAFSDKSFVDEWRKATTAMYLGMKPSFWFQQMLQPLQTTLPEAIMETKGTGLNGSKVWNNSFSNAFELAKYLNAERKGETIATDLDNGLIQMYKKLDASNLMGSVGIEELSGKGEDLKMRYGSDLYKGWNSMLKVANIGGTAAEKFTRIHALSTFYEIGKAKGLQGEALEKYLSTKMRDAMSSWGALDRPTISQSTQLGKSEQKVLKALSKSFFTFKTYGNANMGQYDRLFRNRAWGALGTKLTMGVGMHGVTKFPLIASIYALANLFTEDDMEYETYKLLDELNQENGIKFGNILSKGGLSLSGIDMQSMFNERSSFATDVFSETRSQSAEGKFMETMLGAPYGLSKDIIEGAAGTTKLLAEQISSDEYLTEDERKRALKNMSKMTPLFIRNVLNSMSLSKDGLELRGEQIIKSEDITSADIIYKVLSFNPMSISNTYEYNINGTPAKLQRVDGKITELKRIRKEVSLYEDATARRNELNKVAEMMKEALKEKATLNKQLIAEKRQLLTK